jgi:four helix bundle protein
MSHETVVADQAAWEKTCPDAITSDSIWTLDAYRASLYLLDLARRDMRPAGKPHLDFGLRGQLLQAAGSVSANLAEGYSRSTRADRLRFYAYALGSIRECLTWYYAVGDELPATVFADRLLLLARVRSLLLGLIRSTRGRTQRSRFEL